ncbi:MAG: phosphate acyltransferase PlsX [Armatimonadetes bacterium]|nr:phosphate acyltransferase PlsX [Candidatus Hippobium faecium]
MKIAVDAMGGDYAPKEIVLGAAKAAELYDIEVILVGDETKIKSCLPAKYMSDNRITISPTTEIIEMDDHVDAIRRKKDSSLVVCANMVKNGQADAMVGVGNTAATMSVATLYIGRIPGIHRPAISTLFPGKINPSMILDLGAVADCNVENMIEFAYMGSIYTEKVCGNKNPKVAILSIGEEESKGNELVKNAHQKLKKCKGLNFIGNIEGRQIFDSYADVIVCDGFSGNVLLKVVEGMFNFVKDFFKEKMSRNKLFYIPAMMMLPIYKGLKKLADYSEYGGAPLLGINGVCIIGHGRSNAKAVCNAVKVAKNCVENDLVGSIKTAIDELNKKSEN